MDQIWLNGLDKLWLHLGLRLDSGSTEVDSESPDAGLVTRLLVTALNGFQIYRLPTCQNHLVIRQATAHSRPSSLQWIFISVYTSCGVSVRVMTWVISWHHHGSSIVLLPPCLIDWIWVKRLTLFKQLFLLCFRFGFSVLSQEIGWEGRLQNDLYCVGWDVKPQSVSQSLVLPQLPWST